MGGEGLRLDQTSTSSLPESFSSVPDGQSLYEISFHHAHVNTKTKQYVVESVSIALYSMLAMWSSRGIRSTLFAMYCSKLRYKSEV